MMSKTSKVMMTALMLTLTTMMSAQELGTGNNTTGSKSHDHRASVGVSIAHDRHEGRHQGRPARHGRHDRMGCEPERYLVTDFDVYYGGHKVKGASATSFKDLGMGYAKDSFHVYHDGMRLEGASATSFEILGWGYSKDSFSVYYCGRKIEGASASSFCAGRDGYGKDSFNAYYCGRKIEGASVSSFRAGRDGYASDTFNTYYEGVRIE